MNKLFSNLALPQGLIQGLLGGTALFVTILFFSLVDPINKYNLADSLRSSNLKCVDSAFKDFIGCSEKKPNTEIWQCTSDKSQKKEFENNSGNCSNASLALRIPQNETDNQSCSDEDYSQYIECDSSSCGFEFWSCPKSGDIKSFYNPDGDCILNGGPNDACSI